MATRTQFEAMTAKEKIEHATNQVNRWNRIRRNLIAKRDFRSQVTINADIDAAKDEVFDE